MKSKWQHEVHEHIEIKSTKEKLEQVVGIAHKTSWHQRRIKCGYIFQTKSINVGLIF